MIWNIPIEPLEERYSIQWNQWFEKAFNDNHLWYSTILGDILTKKIEVGSFLDVCGTNFYKATQLSRIVKQFYHNTIDNGDVFFFHDLWFPGLEMLAYIRDGLGLDVKITGCLHAGTYDPNDFLTKQGMGSWGKSLEESWFNLVDKIFVATYYHKDLIVKNRKIDPKKIKVTGFPIYPTTAKEVGKENIIVFPHRLDSEKRPDLFNKMSKDLQPEFPNWKFLKTQEVCITKKDYYNLLNRSKIAVSFAEQETWGIAMQEAVFAECIPVVPDRLSYREMYLIKYCDDPYDHIRYIIRHYDREVFHNQVLKRELTKKGSEAIPNILRELV
jgi:hypothetical protein